MAIYNDGVFGHTTDKAAFIDRADFGIWGKRRKRPIQSMVSIERNFPIGGPKSQYARCVDGFCPVTGNPFQEKYGVIRWPDRVPERRLTLRSQRTPVSCAHVELVSDSLMRKGFRSRVSQVEMTFDLTGTSVAFIKRRLLTTARRFQSYRDELGRETYYVGGFKSPWQVRIYEKRDDVVRFEFIFRREFLRNKGISRPHELVLLRKIDLSGLVWLREIDRAKLRVVDEYAPRSAREGALCSLAQGLSTRQFLKALKARGVVRPDLFVPCALETKMRRLQRRLVW